MRRVRRDWTMFVLVAFAVAIPTACGLSLEGAPTVGDDADGSARRDAGEALEGSVDIETGTTKSCFALEFDGVDDFVAVNDAPDLDPTGPSTIEAWVKLTKDTADELHIVSHHDHGNPGPRLGYLLMAFGFGRDDAGPARLGGCTRYYDGANMNQVGFGTGSSMAIASWVHLAATYDGTELRIHVDGVSRDVRTPTQKPANADFVGVLRIGMNALQQNFAWGGLIDEVRISRVARYSAAQFKPEARFENDANTIALWHFDEGTGTTANDVAGTHSGTISGAKWVPTIACDAR